MSDLVLIVGLSPNSVWEGGNLSELVDKLDYMVEPPNQSQPNQVSKLLCRTIAQLLRSLLPLLRWQLLPFPLTRSAIRSPFIFIPVPFFTFCCCLNRATDRAQMARGEQNPPIPCFAWLQRGPTADTPCFGSVMNKQAPSLQANKHRIS